MSDDAAAEDVTMTFNVKSSNDAKYTVTIPLSNTVLQLKEKLSGKDYADLAPERQRLIYSGRVLKDADTLITYKIKEGNTVHLVKGAASNQRQNPANQSVSSSPNPSQPGVPQNMASGAGSNNMLAGLTGARYAGMANLPSANMFGPDGGMGPPPDPEQLLSMLENPQFASTLNEALANPQVIDAMIQQNPMLRDMGPQMREMMQSPEFRRMMTDPQMLRQSIQMQRMFGGGMGTPGGQQQNSSFPAPGATDTTPEGAEATGEGQQRYQQGQQQPNPFAMLGNPGLAGGNPFAQLFNPTAPGTSQNTSGSPGDNNNNNNNNNQSSDQTNSSVPSTGNESTQQTGQQRQQQQPSNPLTSLANNPLFQNPQMMTNLMNAMNPNNNNSSSSNGSGMDTSQANQQQDPFMAMMQAMMRNGPNPWGFGGDMAGPTNPPDNRPPEERYAEQLRQLNDMGFFEFDRNIEALRRAGGSVQGAIEYLLNSS